MSKYTSQAHIVDYLNRELTLREANLLPMMIEYISTFIESYTNRVWTSVNGTAPVSSTRVYDGNGQKELFIDDFINLTKVELLDSNGDISETLTLSSDWITSPANNSIKNSIYLFSYKFPARIQSVRITATFGGGTTPSGVVMACTQLVARYITNMNNEKNANIKSKKLGDFAVTYGDIKSVVGQMDTELSMLDPYKDILL